MAYRYIDSVIGAATTDVTFGTAQTGSYGAIGAANVFSSLASLASIVTAVADGDIICFSSNHAESHTTSQTFNFGGKNVLLVSTDVQNAENYLVGASISLITTAGIDLTFTNVNATTIIQGLEINFQDQFKCFGDNHVMTLYNCELSKTEVVGTTAIQAIDDGQLLTFIDCGFSRANTSANFFQCGRSSTLRVIRGYGIVGTSKTATLIGVSILGGCYEFYDTDLTDLLSTGAEAFNQLAYTLETQKAIFKHCLFPASFVVTGGTKTNLFYDVKYIASSETQGRYYDFYHETGLSAISQEDTATYLNATYDDVNKFSIKLSSGAEQSKALPLERTIYIEAAADLTTSKTYRVEFISEDGFDNDELEFEINYPTSSANLVMRDHVSSGVADVMATPTTYSTSTETWTDSYTTPVKQFVNLVIPAKAGVTNAKVEIAVRLLKASVDVHIDPQVTIT